MNYSPDNFSILSPEAPNLISVRAGVVGTSDAPVDFTYGGTSDLPDGSQNPEDYAAFPQAMYDEGLIAPGAAVTVMNPATKKKIVVIARHAKTDNETGMDLAPHSVLELGPSSDKKYVLDLNPVKGYPVAQYPSQMQQGASQLPAPEDQSDLSQVSMGEGGAPQETSSEPSGSGPADGIKSKNDDGSITYNDGITIYPDGHWEHPTSTGGVAIYEPGSNKPRFVNNKGDTIHMVKDDRGVSMPYVMKDGKLSRVPIEGESEVTAQSLPEGVTGEEALKGLPKSEQDIAKGYANYDLQPPSGGMASRNPMFYKLYPYIKAYNPNWSATDFKAAQQLKLEYNSSRPGVAGGQITSVNTAIEHLGQLYEAAQKLDQSKIRAYNGISQYISKESGNPDVVAYNSILSEVNKEIERAFLGGVPTNLNQEEGKSALRSANSPEQLKAVITQSLPNLLSARLGEIGFNYEKFFNKPFSGLVRPNAKKVLNGFGVKNFARENDTASQAPAATPSTPSPDSAKAEAERILAESKDSDERAKAEKVLQIIQSLK